MRARRGGLSGAKHRITVCVPEVGVYPAWRRWVLHRAAEVVRSLARYDSDEQRAILRAALELLEVAA